MKIKYQLIAVFSVCLLITASCSPKKDKLIGIKMYELNESPKILIEKWKELNINTAFVSEQVALNTEFRALSEKNNIDVYIIFPIYFNPDALKEDSSLYAITHTGEKAKESWVEFVCPTRKEYQDKMIKKAKQIAIETKADGISIDFIRHFAFWEMIPPGRIFDSIPETCFCDHCLKKFGI